MPTDPRLLTLTQWLSPAFPVGAFAYSHGVEQAIRDGWIANPGDLQDWLVACLNKGSGRSDAICLRAAFASSDPQSVDRTARAFAASSERIAEAEKQGAAFIRTVNTVWGYDLPPLLLCVAVGASTARAELDPDDATALYLQAFTSNLVSAAMRLMPLGQSDGQAVLAALQDEVIRIAAATRDATLDDLFSTTFLSDIAAMRHETLQPRLFQS
jgi:urease accessory protein